MMSDRHLGVTANLEDVVFLRGALCPVFLSPQEGTDVRCLFRGETNVAFSSTPTNTVNFRVLLYDLTRFAGSLRQLRVPRRRLA